MVLIALALVASAASSVSAWSFYQHRMVGAVAQHFLDPETVSVLNTLIADVGDIVNATTWADDVKSTAPYKWSASSHYIDYEDITPVDLNSTVTNVSCEPVFDEVSCPGGYCVTEAIKNYTNRADIHTGYSTALRGEAAKFLAHYVGDISQPLHTCGKLAGGNGWLVKWNGSLFEPAPYSKYRHNLHFIWDQFMIDADILLNYNNSIATYTQKIIDDITTGIWNPEYHKWTHCDTPFTTASGRVVRSACPDEWSADANEFNCATVWNRLGKNTNDTDVDLFTNGYYEANKEIARKQLAKAGLRLATILNSVIPNNGKLTRVNP
ncbi:S1/P1 nuclease [Zopfochytrium polystomum]|nr:S1/P1 nuclease [Zopfochytrium polystomum]